MPRNGTPCGFLLLIRARRGTLVCSGGPVLAPERPPRIPSPKGVLMSLLLAMPGLALFGPAPSVSQPAPTWTDKEVLIAVGSVVGTLLTVGVPVVLFVIRALIAGAKRRARKAEAECQQLR